MSQLKKRWETKGKKWREEDITYIQLACQSYELYREDPNVYYIDHIIDLKSNADTIPILDWIQEKLREKVCIA